MYCMHYNSYAYNIESVCVHIAIMAAVYIKVYSAEYIIWRLENKFRARRTVHSTYTTAIHREIIRHDDDVMNFSLDFNFIHILNNMGELQTYTLYSCRRLAIYLYICPAPQLLQKEKFAKCLLLAWAESEKHRPRENVIFNLNRCRTNFGNGRTRSRESRGIIFEQKMFQDWNRWGWDKLSSPLVPIRVKIAFDSSESDHRGVYIIILGYRCTVYLL